MGKRIVVCCDGTWNTPDTTDAGRPVRTNVARLAVAVRPVAGDGTEQRVCYLRGVGTGRWERLRGGAFGYGLSRNVQEAYRFIAELYEPGDEVFLFGFSRGAYTARSTAGLVRAAGILRPGNLGRLEQAYELYRGRSTHPRDVESQLFRRSFSVEARIRCIGVWDTVGALGIPLPGGWLADRVNRRWAFHDTSLSTWVDGAFHALAIDELRKPFAPTLWQQQPDAPADQRLEQVWFAGVHCDVGGGYPQTGLSDVALLWMADRAGEFGLDFDPAALPAPGTPTAPDPSAPLHDSFRGLYRRLGPLHRSIGATDPAHEHVAASAAARHGADPGYRPPELEAYLADRRQVMPVRW
jgi:uncharacterized protein (DUF2235 family)